MDRHPLWCVKESLQLRRDLLSTGQIRHAPEQAPQSIAPSAGPAPSLMSQWVGNGPEWHYIANELDICLRMFHLRCTLLCISLVMAQFSRGYLEKIGHADMSCTPRIWIQGSTVIFSWLSTPMQLSNKYKLERNWATSRPESHPSQLQASLCIEVLYVITPLKFNKVHGTWRWRVSFSVHDHNLSPHTTY